jgi:hypothetical protein
MKSPNFDSMLVMSSVDTSLHGGGLHVGRGTELDTEDWGDSRKRREFVASAHRLAPTLLSA